MTLFSQRLLRFGHVAGYASGSLYIFGGSDGDKSNAELYKFDCDALFPQTAALSFDGQTVSNVMTVKASPSLNALVDKFSVECWVMPKSFPPNAPAVVKADGSMRVVSEAWHGWAQEEKRRGVRAKVRV